jgi:hypothetical protein
MLTVPPYRSLLFIGLTGLVPLIGVYFLANDSNRHTNAIQTGQMIGAYFAFYAILLLINSLAYFIKARNNGVCSLKLSKWHVILSGLAFAIFAIGTQLGPKIGVKLMGGFVALSLLSFFIGQIVFLVNLAKRNKV